MGDDGQDSEIHVIFRPVGTHGEADTELTWPAEGIGPIYATGVSVGEYKIVITYEHDDRPAEVRERSARVTAEQELLEEAESSGQRNPDRLPLFRRFTDQARRAVVIAQEEARRLGHHQIGTEHLLLGVIGTGETAELEALGISPQDLREDILAIARRTDSRGQPLMGSFTPRPRGALRLAAQEADMLETRGQTEPPGGWLIGTEWGFSRIGTGHLLLGLIHGGEGIAANVLERHGVSLEAMRAQVARRRDARWSLSVRFAIGAASEAEARTVLDQVLARLDRQLPLHGDPAIEPGLQNDIWVATLQLVQGLFEPDDAENRCRWVSSYFGPGPTWVSCESRYGVRWDWPPPIWTRQPGEDDMPLHPAVQAVMISCEVKQP